MKEPPFPLPDAEARRFIARQSHWYQKLYLGNGIWTKPDPEILHETVWSCFAQALPSSLAGLSVLDVGTNAGYFALQTKLRGARHVVGTEVIDMYLEQAETIRKIWGVEMLLSVLCRLAREFNPNNRRLSIKRGCDKVPSQTSCRVRIARNANCLPIACCFP